MHKPSRKKKLDELYQRVEDVTSVIYDEGQSAGECYKLEVMATLLLHLLNVLGTVKQFLLIISLALSALFLLLAFRL